jgi:PST family polysaccharide transporter
MQQAIYPHLAGELKDKTNYIKGMYKYGVVFFAVSLAISLFLAFLSPQIIHFLLGGNLINHLKYYYYYLLCLQLLVWLLFLVNGDWLI